MDKTEIQVLASEEKLAKVLLEAKVAYTLRAALAKVRGRDLNWEYFFASWILGALISESPATIEGEKYMKDREPIRS